MSLEEFPSPTGVLYLLIRCNENYRLDAQGVSVPYWGSLSSNSKKQETPVKNLSDIVSVPYWGSLSSNDNNSLPALTTVQFPSPTGVLYLLIMKKNVRKQKQRQFPSPTGVLYLLIILPLLWQLWRPLRFRPLLGFSIF